MQTRPPSHPDSREVPQKPRYTISMSSDETSVSTPLSLEAIETLVCRAEPRVLFVEPRIIRRVIVQDRRIPGLGLQVPHSKVFTIERERLLVFADRPELGLTPAAELPLRVILIGRPTDDEDFARLTTQERLHQFWRLAFHGRVHAEIEQQIDDQQLTSRMIAEHLKRIGAGEFAEIRQVLSKDDLLLPPQDDEAAFVEFVAVALELKYFAPWDLDLFFPAIRDWEALNPLWDQLDDEQWYAETRPEGAPERLAAPETEVQERSPSTGSPRQSAFPAPADADRMLTRAVKSTAVGNQVKAAILRMRAAIVDFSSSAVHREAAEEELRQLARRLQSVWKLGEAETDAWWRAMCPLLAPAAIGYRSLEARILYDLQKVCVAHERGIYRFNVWGWVKSFGKESIRLELPLLETVQSAKYLRVTADRAASIRIAATDRKRLMALIDQVQSRSEQELRVTVRPMIDKVFDQVGLVPQNVPERVARRKVIEGLLDRLVERGYITMGDLRDSLSQSHLKLPDVSGPIELAWGDRLLRADRHLGRELDGVYRPGAIYLRWSQRLSSLAFGTGIGRFLVRNLVLPFGGAYIILAALLHFVLPQHSPPSVVKVPQANIESQQTGNERPTPAKPDRPIATTGEKTEPQSRPNPDSASGSAPDADTTKDSSAVEKIGDLAVDAIKGAKEIAGTATTKAIDVTLGDAPQKNLDLGKAAAQSNEERSPYFTVAWGVSWFVFGVFLWMLMHRPKFRRSVAKFFGRLWSRLVWLVYEFPKSLIESTWVRRILESRTFAILKAYVARPALVTVVVIGVIQGLLFDWGADSQRWLSWRIWLEAFLGLNLFLNSPAGRSVEERVLDICVRAWHELRFRIFAVIYLLVMDVFHDIMQWIEQSLYTVDEWMRFRSGDRRQFVLLKILLGSVWSIFSYVLRLVITLLVEPQINPIKHFPVVTVSHKILLPYGPQLHAIIRDSFGMTEASSVAIAGTIVMLAPGVIGFLVWELKENWQLYVANRPKGLSPVRVGSHGETVVALLRPGFRSGTLAKIYNKLRAALRLESDPGHGYRSTRELHHIDAVTLEVRRFVEREFCTLIEETKLLGSARVSVGRLMPATNRFDVELVNSEHPEAPAIVRWEDLEGWFLARLVQPGWLDLVSPELRQQLDQALAGLYKQAGVDVIREQVCSTLSAESQSPPDLTWSRETLTVQDGDQPAVSYTLQRDGLAPRDQKLEPKGSETNGWPTVTRAQLIFGESPVVWSEWVESWTKAARNA
jgi:hypothetical protein